MTQEITRQEMMMPQVMETVMMAGDLGKLTPKQRLDYYGHVCASMQLNPLTKPFDYISLNGKLTLYATKNCTDQLRSRDSVSIKISNRQVLNGIYLVTVAASTPDGRVDESTGAVNVEGLKGEFLANAYMKAETKAKRRATLSICGMGLLDELEVDDTPSSRRVHVDQESGKISEGTGTVAPEMRPQPKEEPRRTPPPQTIGQGAPVQQPTAQEQPGVDPDVQALWARMTSKESSLKVFAELKDACKKVLGEGGESSYYQVLGRFGVQHANEFKSTKPARECAAFIFSRLKDIQAEQTSAEIKQGDGAPPAEEGWEEAK